MLGGQPEVRRSCEGLRSSGSANVLILQVVLWQNLRKSTFLLSFFLKSLIFNYFNIYLPCGNLLLTYEINRKVKKKFFLQK